MKRWLPLLLLMMTLLTACASPSAPLPPAEPPPTQAPPAPPPAAPATEEEAGPRLVERWYYRASPGLAEVVEGATQIRLPWGREEAVVGSGEVMFTWVLEKPAPEMKERIRWSGYEPDRLNIVENVVQAHFPAGGPARWEVWLDGVKGSKTVLERRPEPSVQIGYRHDGGDLVMIDGAELNLPPGRFTLEFRFDQAITYKSFDIWRSLTYEQNRPVGFPGSDFAWVEPNRLVWSMDRVPSKLVLEMGRLQAQATHLPVNPHPLVVRNTETEAYLERVNPATGERERVLNLVPEISEAHLSPDGRHLALRSWEKGERWQNRLVTVADLQRRTLVPVDMTAAELHWAGSALVNFGYRWVEGAGWEAWDPQAGGKPVFNQERFSSATPSPDGRFVAELRGAEGATAPGSVPNSLWLTELATGERREVPNFVHGWVWGKGGDWTQWTAWSPDGRQVAALDPVRQAGECDLVLYDIESGERRVLRKGLQVITWGHHLRWSPDGTKILLDGYNKAIIPLDGGPVVKLPDSFWRGAYWDGRGERILAALGDWRSVFVYSLADGSRVELGDGLPVGWDGDWVYIIRWAGSDARHVEQLP